MLKCLALVDLAITTLSKHVMASYNESVRDIYSLQLYLIPLVSIPEKPVKMFLQCFHP